MLRITFPSSLFFSYSEVFLGAVHQWRHHRFKLSTPPPPPPPPPPLVNATNFRRATDKVRVREVAYEVDVKQIFKASKKARIALEEKSVRLWKRSTGSRCGRLGLTPGEMWLLAGGVGNNKLVISLCNFAQIWSKLTPFQREGFQQSYDGCDCAESERGLSCSLGSSDESDCHERYSIWKPSSAGCHWASSEDYNKCRVEQ